MLLAPLAVDAVIKVIDPTVDTNVNLKDIKVMKQLGYAKKAYYILLEFYQCFIKC